MNKEVNLLIEQANSHNLPLSHIAYSQSFVTKRKRMPKIKRDRQIKASNIAVSLKKEGKSGKEISKAVFKELHKVGGYQTPTREDKAKIRETLIQAQKINSFIPDDYSEVIEELELELDYDSSNSEAVNEIACWDFRPFFKLDELQRNAKFSCKLIRNNEAWYSNDLKTGYYRYFTRNKETMITNAFNIFDMTEIVYGYNFSRSLRYIGDKLQIKWKEGDWMQDQEHKYLQNISLIERTDALKTEFNTLYKYIKAYLPILQKLQTIGVANITSQDISVDNTAVFLSSSRYIATYDDKKVDVAKVSRAINLFALLGLIKKERMEDVPADVLERAKNVTGDFAKFNLINMYTIPLYDYMTLMQASKKVEKLKENKVASKSISKEIVEEVFGKEEAEKVYGEKDTRKNVVKDQGETEEFIYPF